MSNVFTPESLEELINSVQTATPKNDSWFATPGAWTWELNRNPQNFYRDDDGKLMWLGYKVVTCKTFSGAEKKFWALADKIIPKEKSK